ncbi:MAG TPA: ketoacyl-ACP synthase III [Longilinea sp.]|nr:ketoacyl-ACP synthase III [Longilinea sp.]
MLTRIQDIAYHLPEQVITNEQFGAQYPEWDMKHVAERSGVLQRHVAAEGETALDLAYTACQKLLAAHPGLKEKIDGIVFCTQSPDYIMPPNSYLLHQKLTLPDNVLAFDFNLACSGFIYGLALSRGLMATGMASNILLVTADTYSKYINPGDRSVRTLFGDGAAVTWLAADETPGVVDIELGSSGKGHKAFIIPAGGLRLPRSADTAISATDENGNVHSRNDIYMDGMGILTFVNSKVPKQIRALLQRNDLTVENVDLFVFHQASKVTLDSLARILKIKPEKEFRNLATVGNTVSASIPIALKDAQDNGKLKPGDTVLVSGFGVGLSWGSAILKF